MAELLDERSRAYLRARRDDDILCDLDPHKAHHASGLLLLQCGDADISCGLLDHYRQLSGCDRIHQITVNGGALNLSSASPVPRRRAYAITGLQLMYEIEEACSLKGLDKVVVCGHSACGAGRAAKLSEEDAMRLIVQGKLELREFFHRRGREHIEIGSMMHVRWNGDEPRLYFLDAARYARTFMPAPLTGT